MTALATARPLPASPAPAAPAATPFRGLFPDWRGQRPLAWFFAEEWLEARAASDFPTNSRGMDEDVNIYIIDLLCRWAAGDPRPGALPGRDPLLLPPDGIEGAAAAEHYRRQADHRLLALGLCDRGDLVRRRRTGWRMTEAETRRRDLAVASRCYALAANLTPPGRGDRQALAGVWTRLAAHTDGYVQAMQIMARRRLGLGARLDDTALSWLMTGDPDAL